MQRTPRRRKSTYLKPFCLVERGSFVWPGSLQGVGGSGFFWEAGFVSTALKHKHSPKTTGDRLPGRGRMRGGGNHSCFSACGKEREFKKRERKEKHPGFIAPRLEPVETMLRRDHRLGGTGVFRRRVAVAKCSHSL